MTVYVDRLMDYGWRLGPSCHMFADTLEELHAMAKAIGMKYSWFQDKPALPHYDLVESRRKRAIAQGAIEDNDFRQMQAHRRVNIQRIAREKGLPDPYGDTHVQVQS